MAEQKFKPGDVVELKSGGPAMTVAGEEEFGELMCTWFDGKKKMDATFEPEQLKPYKPPTGFA
jgi:uncharacterized protein YodC (DUF2158 family)